MQSLSFGGGTVGAALTATTASILVLAASGPAANAQQPPQQNERALAPCGMHGDTEVICGARSPEDLEVTPDGKYLVVAPFVTFRGAQAAGIGLQLFDVEKQTFASLPLRSEAKRGWGDTSCPGPIGDALAPHGISLGKRTSGEVQLFVVNHGGRESIEMYELQANDGAWRGVWRGCVVMKKDANDVAAMPDGSFFATEPTALGGEGDIFDGHATGYIVRWTPNEGETILDGTNSGYPNGVLAGSDGRYLYYDAWTASEVHKYDVRGAKNVATVKLDFMPDNVTWSDNDEILAAGIKGVQGDCPAGSGAPCIQEFGVAAIDTGDMKAKTVFDSAGKGGLISGVSVAVKARDSIYVGSFQGERLVKIPAP
jgi:hypothetical protein